MIRKTRQRSFQTANPNPTTSIVSTTLPLRIGRLSRVTIIGQTMGSLLQIGVPCSSTRALVEVQNQPKAWQSRNHEAPLLGIIRAAMASGSFPPMAAKGERLIIAKRWGRWRLPPSFHDAVGVIRHPCPQSPQITNEPYSKVIEFLAEGQLSLPDDHAIPWQTSVFIQNPRSGSSSP